MYHQIEVLTKVTGTKDLYTTRFVYGDITFGSRDRTESGSRYLPFGTAIFTVPSGTVASNEVIRFMGETYRISGVGKIPPYFIKDEIEASVKSISVTISRTITFNGDPITFNGAELTI